MSGESIGNNAGNNDSALWDALAKNSASFSSNMLSPEARAQLDAEIAQIDEDEHKDFNNDFKINHKHTKEEYNNFRQQAISEAIAKDISKLSEKEIAELNAVLLQIDEDERKDYDNDFKISHKHTKDEYTKFRQSAIASAIEKANASAAESGQSQTEQSEQDQSQQAESSQTESGQPQQTENDQAQQSEQTQAIQKEKAQAVEEEQNQAEQAEKNQEAKKELEEYEKIRDRIEAEKRRRQQQQELANEPLVAINADFTHDKRELAHDFAEQELNEELSHAGFIKKIWKGTLFKKYFQKKYEREIYEGSREFTHNGERVDIDDVIGDRSESAISRFVLGVTEEYQGAIHTKAGEKVSEADARTTEVVREAIEWFATAQVPEGGSMSDLMTEFGNRVRSLQAEGKDQDQPLNDNLINNYYDVAVQARERVEHGIAIDRVMENFRIYNADVRNNIRTQAHRDAVDKIVNKLESMPLLQFVPAEMMAAAVGTASALTQTGARALAGVAGGLAVSGVAAGLRERNRVTEDRARMARDIAAGYQYEGRPGERNNKGKRAKYEARLGGTLYDTRPATELTNNLLTAMQSDNRGDLLRAIAEARVRVDFSDSEEKDLIAYSSADKLGDERLKLDVALIRAERSLTETDQIVLKNIRKSVENKINEDVDEKDADFRRVRAAQAIKQAGKTIALGATTFAISQEAIAAFDPNKIGILEKTGILKRSNNEGASETLLARLSSLRSGGNVYTTEPIQVNGDQTDKIKELEAAGYTRNEVSPAHTSIKQDIIEVSPAKSEHAIKVHTSFADNGTKFADGNELGLHLENGGYVARMSGNSTMGDQVFNYQQLASAGRLKGHINIGGGTFEVASKINSNGQLVLPIDQNGNITTTTGETIRAIGSNGEKLFKNLRIVVDNGVDSNGVHQVVSLATETGSDTFSGTMQQVAETLVEEPAVYEYSKTVTTGLFDNLATDGIVLPFASRVGIGGVEQQPTSPTPNNPQPRSGDRTAVETVDAQGQRGGYIIDGTAA